MVNLTPEEQKLIEFANSVKDRERTREKVTLKDSVLATIILDTFEGKREIKAYMADFQKGNVFICFGFPKTAEEELQGYIEMLDETIGYLDDASSVIEQI